MTPWQKVATRFGWRKAARSKRGEGVQVVLARAIGMHRSSVCRYLSDPVGLVEGEHQLKLIRAAREAGITLDADDFVPDATIEELKDEEGTRKNRRRAAPASVSGGDLP